MYERIVEIIVYVISELKQNKQISEIDLDELRKRGYSKSEISTAFSWIADRLDLASSSLSNDEFVDNNSFRVLHEAEMELFTKEAWGEMLQFHAIGLINNEHIEILIENSILSGLQQIDSSQIKSFIAQVIFSSQKDIYPGNRLMLSGDEKIN